MARRGSVSLAASLAYVAVNGLIFLLYVVPELNSPEPSIAGLSVAFVYSIIVWILLMVLVVVISLTVWRG